MKYFKYEIEERKYSSNALVGVYLDENKKERRNFILALGHNIPKKEADLQVEQLKNMYNEKILC